MIAITEEFKEALVEEINKDADFGFILFKAILESAGERIPSVTYLDKALARQTIELDRKLDELKGSLSFEIDEKLDAQARRFDEKLDTQARRFDEKLDDLAQQFDEKLDNCIGKLERFIDAKLGYIGSRWGEDVEAMFLSFAQETIAQWGGTAQKWRRKTRLTDEHGHVFESRYEIDIVVTNGKTMLVEVKSKCDLDDVERFLENVAYYLLTQDQKTVETAILTFFITTPARELAEKEGIRLIMPS